MEAFINGMPKAELHVHLEGTLEPDMLLALAQRYPAVSVRHSGDRSPMASTTCRCFSVSTTAPWTYCARSRIFTISPMRISLFWR